MRRISRATLWAVVVFAVPLAAQESKNTAPWKDSFYPLFISQANEFPIVVVHFEERKQADYFARSPFAGRFQVDIGGGTKGSHFALVGFDAPLLWKDWRFAARAGAAKAARFGYFGLGNNTKFIEDSVDDDTSPFFYRKKRNRYLG